MLQVGRRNDVDKEDNGSRCSCRGKCIQSRIKNGRHKKKEDMDRTKFKIEMVIATCEIKPVLQVTREYNYMLYCIISP